MKVIIFGATGMVGQGVLRECIVDPEIDRVLTVGRRPVEMRSEKLAEIIRTDFLDYGDVEAQLSGYDACFFCLGLSSLGISEEQYRHVTQAMTLAAARVLARVNPGMTFIYVSGGGADSTGRGRLMWARVKGETENAVLGLPFKAAYVFRPGAIVPLHGARSRTAWLQAFYGVTAPLLAAVAPLAPSLITTTEQVGKAMIKVARSGYPRKVLENADINGV
jgi:uncharacterized protein YbjT (DUF2867 family)